ncbi:MAG: hypothetical protein RBS19_07550 [Bacteroidales bacterium]|nr:hypothetical protein [Bacteroidales bacterium]MDY0216792.1 hypothetical protein [Bacteroidales bacterium]
MEIKDFFKKPVVILTSVILISYLILPYFRLNLGTWGGYSKSGIGLFFTIFDSFSFLNLLTILIPAAAGYLLFLLWNKETNLVMILKIILAVMHIVLFVYIAFLADKSSIKFVGFGLWLSLILSIALFFDDKIEELVCKNKPQTPQE